MKKVLLAIVAVFAMTSMSFAQIEMNKNTVKLTLNSEQTLAVEQYLADAQQTEGFNFNDLKDVTFNNETGTFEFETKSAGDNPMVGAILAIFLGSFGIHHFYAGDTLHGLLHLIFCWTGISGLIGLIEGVIWLIDQSSYPKTLFQMF